MGAIFSKKDDKRIGENCGTKKPKMMERKNEKSRPKIT